MGRDCDDLLKELHDLLHGDLDTDRKAHLKQHLEECQPCLETADFQAQLRDIVARKCGEPVPDQFKAKIAAMLHVEISTDVVPSDSAERRRLT